MPAITQEYSVWGALADGKGLTATYYNNSNATGSSVDIGAGEPVSVRAQGTDDAAPIDWSASAARPAPIASLASTGGFGARWAGFVSATMSATYTFALELSPPGAPGGDVASRVKLWLDNRLVIDQWSSLALAAPTSNMRLESAGFYDISVLFKCHAAAAACAHKLSWRSTASAAQTRVAVPTSALYQHHALGARLGQLRVTGGIACADTTSASGSALSLATAGRLASFTVTSRDAFSNPRQSATQYFVQLIGAEEAPLYGGASAALAPLLGTSLASFRAFEAKSYSLFVMQGGVNIKGSPFMLAVKPDGACGATSTMSGSGITAASVSPASNTFRIQARDAFGNQRSDLGAQGEAFFVRVVRTRSPDVQGSDHGGLPAFSGSKALSDPGDIPSLHASITTDAASGADLRASYTIPVVPSPAGQAHYLYASWIQSGGLHATYYSAAAAQTDVSLGLPVPCSKCALAHKFPSTISSGGSTSPSALDAALTGADSVCGSTSCNVWIRWSGALRACLPSTSASSCVGGAESFSRDFRWTMATEDRIKLWVDNRLVIDQWSSLSAAAPSGSAVFGSASAVLDVFAEYQRLSSDVISSAPVFLSDTGEDGTFQPLHSMRLYVTEDLQGSPSFLNLY